MAANNFNFAEDCIGYTRAGYADNVCNELLPCLCEWPSQTSSEYLTERGPALTARAEAGHAAMMHSSTASSFSQTRTAAIQQMILL